MVDTKRLPITYIIMVTKYADFDIGITDSNKTKLHIHSSNVPSVRENYPNDSLILLSNFDEHV